ncbi:deoxynucleoside kinase [Mesorhizobium japonicum]|uniref:deoxynucleoside kinase n=1 Tax=Mesorhizobium japonicum TaxID=2066070 RepID=UPI003B599319
MSVYYSFAGNIGVGKTTLATKLATRLNLPVVAEAVDANPFLAHFYQDPATWAFRLQMFNIASRAHSILGASQAGGFVLDRSFEEDGVYVDAALELGFVSNDEHAVYFVLPPPDVLFYLRTDDVELLRARIRSRGRSVEAGIEASYLRDLQNRYDDWFARYDGEKVLIDVTADQPVELPAEILGRVGH